MSGRDEMWRVSQSNKLRVTHRKWNVDSEMQRVGRREFAAGKRHESERVNHGKFDVENDRSRVERVRSRVR